MGLGRTEQLVAEIEVVLHPCASLPLPAAPQPLYPSWRSSANGPSRFHTDLPFAVGIRKFPREEAVPAKNLFLSTFDDAPLERNMLGLDPRGRHSSSVLQVRFRFEDGRFQATAALVLTSALLSSCGCPANQARVPAGRGTSTQVKMGPVGSKFDSTFAGVGAPERFFSLVLRGGGGHRGGGASRRGEDRWETKMEREAVESHSATRKHFTRRGRSKEDDDAAVGVSGKKGKPWRTERSAQRGGRRKSASAAEGTQASSQTSRQIRTRRSKKDELSASDLLADWNDENGGIGGPMRLDTELPPARPCTRYPDHCRGLVLAGH
mgnify:CR=1 FL=1